MTRHTSPNGPNTREMKKTSMESSHMAIMEPERTGKEDTDEMLKDMSTEGSNTREMKYTSYRSLNMQ
jgi:hypothetical protein